MRHQNRTAVPLLLTILLLILSSPAPGQDPAEEITAAFLDAIADGNAWTVLELVTDDSRAKAIEAADSLHAILMTMTTRELGEFFSGLGLEAAPDEIEHWESTDFFEILLISSGFDSTFAQPEEIDGIWRMDVKNGVFIRMLEDLDIPAP